MKKKVIYAGISAAILVTALVLLILDALNVFSVGMADLGLFFLVLMAGFGVLNLAFGLWQRNAYYVFSSALLLAGTFVYCAIEWIPIRWYVIVAIAAVILVLVAILAFLVLRWASPTEGANDSPNYKPYAQRQEEKQEETEQKIAEEQAIIRGEVKEFQIKSFGEKKD